MKSLRGLESPQNSLIGRINLRDTNIIILLATLLPGAIIFFVNMPYLRFIMMNFFAYAIYTSSWDLLYSYSGQLSLGQALPFGLGAFFTIIVTHSFGVPLVLSAIVGTLAATVVSGSVGTTTIRLKPGYQGIAILLFSQVLYWISLIAYGEEGVSVFIANPLGPTIIYLGGLVIFAFAMLGVYLLYNSKYRLKLLAIKGDNLAADVCGINVPFQKAVVFYISSFLAAIAGAYYGIFTSHADFSVFAVPNSFLPIGMAIVGGIALVGGSIIGSAIISVLINVLPIWYSIAVTYFAYGIVVILILKLRPAGIMGFIHRGAKNESSKPTES